MPRVPIAFAYPDSLPPAASTPHPSPSPLQTSIASTLGSSDYDLVAVPLTNGKWQDRWEHLCLRPMEEELDPESPEALARDQAREAVDREADEWRKDGALRREEMNVTRLEEARSMIAMASDWLELDSGDEGIRFDSELVSTRSPCVSANPTGQCWLGKRCHHATLMNSEPQQRDRHV